MTEPMVCCLKHNHVMMDINSHIPQVIAGVIKWCWSRIQGGIVGWDAYELFKVGEIGRSNLFSPFLLGFGPWS